MKRKENKNQNEIKLVAQTVNSTLLQFYGYSTIKDICKPAAEEPEDKRSLQELLEELNALVGLKQVKEKVHDLIVYQQVQKMRREKNLHSAKNTLHLAFTGNPGTGKTTVISFWVEYFIKKGSILCIFSFSIINFLFSFILIFLYKNSAKASFFIYIWKIFFFAINFIIFFKDAA